MKDGGVATKLQRLGMNLSRVGTCDGTVVISKSGNPYCKTKTVILHSSIPGSRDGVVDVVRSGCEVQKKEIEYLKQLRSRNAANINGASRRIERLTKQLDSTLKTIEQLTGKKQDRGRAPRARTTPSAQRERSTSLAASQMSSSRVPSRAPPPAPPAPPALSNPPAAMELASVQKRTRNESPAGNGIIRARKTQTDSKRTRR